MESLTAVPLNSPLLTSPTRCDLFFDEQSAKTFSTSIEEERGGDILFSNPASQLVFSLPLSQEQQQ
jgi:hypothetical protein